LPFAFFGHNMGALVAYELTHRLRSEQLPGPEHLFVSGLSAPQLGQPFGPLEALSDNELVATITRIGGIPQGILRRPSFLALILPVLRADFRLCSDYRYARPLRQLSCPVTALGGAGDPLVSGWQLQAWDKQTSGSFELRMYPGGHCFLRTARTHVLAVIQDALGAPEALRRAS
jgi:medium-chain acyl-[acyl-carrier-protein] hydrolase